MRFWFSHSADVSIRDQLVRQVSLGILSGELRPGEKLPSIRALAARFDLHRNTVSSAYRQLEAENWISIRQGSGAYVRASGRNVPPAKKQALGSGMIDKLLDQLVQCAQQAGIAAPDLMARLEHSLKQPPQLLLVEADPELVNIVLFEIAAAGRTPPEVCRLAPEHFAAELQGRLDGRTAVVLPSKAAAARQALGETASVVVLEISPVASSLAAHLPRSRDHLVAIASHWPRFLDLVRTLLISTGFDDESLIVRDARRPDWSAGLAEAANVVCDSLTRAELPPGAKPLVFALLTAAALEHFRLRETM